MPGAVIVWDTGGVRDLTEGADGARRSRAATRRSGWTAQKLRGGWTLQRTGGGQAAVAADQAPRRGRGRAAQPGEHRAASVLSGRTVEEVAADAQR